MTSLRVHRHELSPTEFVHVGVPSTCSTNMVAQLEIISGVAAIARLAHCVGVGQQCLQTDTEVSDSKIDMAN